MNPLRVHATALVLGEDGVLVRGPSGAGKTALALALVADAARAGRFARLVADDIVLLEARHGRLVARPHPNTAGLVERRGIGVLAAPHQEACVVRLVADLGSAGPPERMPDSAAMHTDIGGIVLPRLRLWAGATGSERTGSILDMLAAFRTGS